MGHHEHDHAARDFGRAFTIGIALNAAFIVVEAACGFLSDSLALLADAGHNLGDVMGLLVAWGAIRLSQWRPTRRHTYGLRRSSILAALLNALFLLVSVGAIVWEAVRRFTEPEPVNWRFIVAVALAGIVVNGATALLFRKGSKHDLNVRGAFLHMAADAAVSAGVVIAGLAIAVTGIVLIDPVVSILIGIAILIGTWNLLRKSLDLALDAVPDGIDAEAVQSYLRSLPTVKDVHHVHIWALSTTHAALTAHLVLERPATDNSLLERIGEDLHEHHGIDHATIQFEAMSDSVCLTRQCSLHFSRRGRHEAGRRHRDEHHGGGDHRD